MTQPSRSDFPLGASRRPQLGLVRSMRWLVYSNFLAPLVERVLVSFFVSHKPMKTSLIVFLLVTASLCFGTPETSRLDGVWQGPESYYIVGGIGIGTGINTTKPVTVIIADGGSKIGVVGGHFIRAVRFIGHWTKDGLTAYPAEGQTIDKTNHITFTLNGDKLIEKGLVEYNQIGGSVHSQHQKAYGNLSGELHRATMADGV